MKTFEVRELFLDQIRALYRKRLKADFPKDELKPLIVIERAHARGGYVCYGALDREDILAYAFFVKQGGLALLDYYAVRGDLRGRGR